MGYGLAHPQSPCPCRTTVTSWTSSGPGLSIRKRSGEFSWTIPLASTVSPEGPNFKTRVAPFRRTHRPTLSEQIFDAAVAPNDRGRKLVASKRDRHPPSYPADRDALPLRRQSWRRTGHRDRPRRSGRGRSFVRSRRQLGTRGHRRGDRRQVSTLSEADWRGFRRGGGRLRLDERRRGADRAVSLAVSGAGMANARRAGTDANTYGARA
jgi:hypothetical protein